MDHPLEIQVKTVWMHAVTRSCGYSADLRDLAAGAADTATSTPSLLRHRPDCCLRLTPGPVTVRLLCALLNFAAYRVALHDIIDMPLSLCYHLRS